MVLINFALEKLGSQIKSDKVSVDGYEAEKLLYGETGWQKKGFLAERFIKPPVTLTLRLPCPVSLHRIILDPQVGGQRSSAVEIYTAVAHRTVKLTKFEKNGGSAYDGRNTDSSVCFNRTETDSSKKELISEPEPLFVRVASVRCPQPGRVCFTNPRVRGDHSSSTNNFPDIESFPYHAEIRHHQWWAVSAVEFVAIRITGTVSGGVVAVGALQVWGQPARSCPHQLKEDIVNKYLSLIQPKVGKIKTHSNVTPSFGTHSNSAEKSNSAVSANSISPDQVDVPDEFLDPLTCEVMVTPMLLPSGHTVDLTTIDRFTEVEATHGRQPSDPFTGLMFTSTRCPVLNRGLKIRIDRFLSENAQDPVLSKVPRVVGHAGEHESYSFDHKVHTQLGNLTQRTSAPVGVLVATERSRLKRKHFSHSEQLSSENPPAKLSVSHSPVPNSQHGHKETDHSTGNAKQLVSATVMKQCMSHEDRLKDSLSNSLSSVLEGLPTFTATPPVQQEEQAECSACEKTLDSKIMVYKLPCSHVLCRPCLTATDRTDTRALTCPSCKAGCQRADITRIHV